MRKTWAAAAVIVCALMVLALVPVSVHAAEEAGVTPKAFLGEMNIRCDAGGDIRIRQVHLDDIPIIADPPGITRGGENHFFRFRTRLWGGLYCGDNLALRARLVNEFRHVEKPEGPHGWDVADELIVDSLYLDIKNLFSDTVDLRIGRQDLIYGTGKVLLEGTPLDGSRTIYCDAVKLTYKGLEKTTIDLLGINNEAENDLAIGNEHRNLTGVHPADEQFAERGAGIYIKDKCIEKMPMEAYYFFKNEEDFITRGAGATNDDVDVHTVGVRLMPKLCDGVGANLEVAYQTGEQGDQDKEGLMVDAVVNWDVPIAEDMKPRVGAGLYYLSGDDPDTTDEDEGWNPLWARWPQYSELYIYAFDADGAGRWSNVMMPHVDLSMALCKNAKIKALVGLLMAPEENGPGGGDERGLLATVRADFTLAEKLLTEKDKLFGHLTVEVLDPGDYYNVDDMAHFARWEVSYKF